MTEPQHDAEPVPPATPGWVKALGIAAALLVVLLVLLVLTGGAGDHGPGLHGGG